MTDTALHQNALQHEALRQQWLISALWGGPQQQATTDKQRAWLAGPTPRTSRGLQVYAANAGALAERALAAAFPTISQLVGAESFAGLARALWRTHPPLRGDIGQWGEALPTFIAAAPQLKQEPCLADVARLDWAVHLAEQAGDSAATTAGLAQLASTEPALLRLRLAASTALVSSPYPVASIWLAHRSSAADRFGAVRAAFAAGAGEQALVWRDGRTAQMQTQVQGLSAPAAQFTQAVLDGASLDAALHLAGSQFAFEPWLLAALQQGWLAAVETDAAYHVADLPPTTRPPAPTAPATTA